MIGIEVNGIKEAIKMMNDIATGTRRTILKQGMYKGALIFLRAAKSRVRKRKRHLFRSLIRKAKAYPRTGKAVGVVGPNARYVRAYVIRRGKNKGKTKYIEPWRYAHLVEKGHQKGKGKYAARPYPFMKPVFYQHYPEALRAAGKEMKARLGKYRLKRWQKSWRISKRR